MELLIVLAVIGCAWLIEFMHARRLGGVRAARDSDRRGRR
jgi:hypothetical protein